jgi:hypothetical protein
VVDVGAGSSVAAQAASTAAASEVEAACVRAGWALVQGLCSLGRQWVSTNWVDLCLLLHCDLSWQLEECTMAAGVSPADKPAAAAGAAAAGGTAIVAGAGTGDTTYLGIVEAWRWVATVSAGLAVLAIARCVGHELDQYSGACDGMATLLSIMLRILHMPFPSQASAGEIVVEDPAAISARVLGGTMTPDDASGTIVFSSVECACAFVSRRCALQLAACCLESAALLPITCLAFVPTHAQLISVCTASLTGGLLGIDVASFEQLAEGRGSLHTAVGHVAAPAANVLVAALNESSVAEVSFERLCIFSADAVLTRGMGEAVDPCVGDTTREVLSSKVRSSW